MQIRVRNLMSHKCTSHATPNEHKNVFQGTEYTFWYECHVIEWIAIKILFSALPIRLANYFRIYLIHLHDLRFFYGKCYGSASK